VQARNLRWGFHHRRADVRREGLLFAERDYAVFSLYLRSDDEPVRAVVHDQQPVRGWTGVCRWELWKETDRSFRQERQRMSVNLPCEHGLL